MRDNAAAYQFRRGGSRFHGIRAGGIPRAYASSYGGGRSKKRRYYKKYGKKRRRKKRRILTKKQVKVVKGLVRSGAMKWDHKAIMDSFHLSSAVNQVKYSVSSIMTRTDIDLMLSLPVYFGQDNAGLDREEDIEFNVLDQNVKFYMKAHTTYKMRNNSSTPLKLHIWTVRAKFSTNQALTIDLAKSLDNEFGSDGALEVEPSFWPQHATAFMKTNKLSNHRSIYLGVGQEAVYTIKCGKFLYDHEVQQLHDFTYLKNHTVHALFRLEGVVCHDKEDATKVGISEAHLDVVTDTHYKFRKLGDLRIPRITYDDSLDTMTTPMTYAPSDPTLETFTEIL